jgi:hypothetical protein
VQGRKLDFFTASTAEIKDSTSASYTFTTQKNNNCNDKVVQGFSGNLWYCPVKATVQRMPHHHSHKSRCTVPLTSYYRGNRKTLVKAKDVMEVICNAISINVHRNGIHASEVSAQSLRTGGAMALLHGRVDLSNIRMMGRCQSDVVWQYLHVQARPIMGNYAARMFNEGTYSLLPGKTTPTINIYDDDIKTKSAELFPPAQQKWQMGSNTGPLSLSRHVQYQGGKWNPLELPFQPIQVGVQVGSSDIRWGGWGTQ